MKILFAAPENAWGGFLGSIRKELPEYAFEASGRFAVETLQGFDVLIPTMCSVTKDLLDTADRLRLIQQCGSGLEGVDIEAARGRAISGWRMYPRAVQETPTPSPNWASI